MALIKRSESAESFVPTESPQHNAHTILGPQAEFEGKLVFQGAVRIDGKFRGEVMTSDVLVIGEQAEVDAQVNVGTLIVHGTFRGSAKAKDGIELKAPGRYFGSLISPRLVIQPGVIFEGNSKMENTETKE